MAKKTKQIIKNPLFISGVVLVILWLLFAFFFGNLIGLTGNPTFLQVQIQMLPASIGIILILITLVKEKSLALKVLQIVIITIVAAYIIYFGIGLLLISIYGLKLNFPPS
jgi:uncharacterized membrane protein YhdT